MYGLNAEAFNDSDSIDFDFFNSEGEQINTYAKLSHKNSSQIITTAIIETQNSTLKDNTLSSKNVQNKAIINSECVEILKDVNYAISKLNSHPLYNTKSINSLVSANESALRTSSDSSNFDDKESSDNSSDSTFTSVTSELTSVSPCSLTSDSSSSFEENGVLSMSPKEDNCIETQSNGGNKAEEHAPKQNIHNRPNINSSNLCDQTVRTNLSNKSLCDPKVPDVCQFLKDKKSDIQVQKETNDISFIEEQLGCMSLTNLSSTSNLPRSLVYKGPSKIKMRRKENNLTFKREEILKIERDNLILLRKIMAHSKPKTVTLNYPFTHKKTSAAINRARQQKKIDQDNYVLYSKISAVGGIKKVF